MSARKEKFARADLLVDPDFRIVVEDKGVTWVTDRFICVRADLFARPPKQSDHAPHLKVTALRHILSKARGTGKALRSQPVVYAPRWGSGAGHARVYAVGCALIALNERVSKTLLLADLQPRYIPETGMTAWYRTVRGRDALYAVMMPVHMGMGTTAESFADASGGAA